jgi:hypothetical protein
MNNNIINNNNINNTDNRVSPDDKINKINKDQPSIFKFKIKNPEIRKTSEIKNPIFKTFNNLNSHMQNYGETKTKIEKEQISIKPQPQPQVININLKDNNKKLENDREDELFTLNMPNYNEDFKPESNKTTNKTTAGTDTNENIINNDELNKIFETYGYKENLDPNIQNNKKMNNKIFEEDFNIKFDSFDEKDNKDYIEIKENIEKIENSLLLSNQLDKSKEEKQNNSVIDLDKLDKLYNEDIENYKIKKENKENRLLIEELKDFIINMKEDKYASSSEDDTEKEIEKKNAVYPTYSELNVVAKKGL